MRRLVIACLLLLGCETNVTECRSSRSCIDRHGNFGLCARNRCAFYDDSCPTLYRWDDSAGDLAAMCVDAIDIPDANLPDARVRDAITPDG